MISASKRESAPASTIELDKEIAMPSNDRSSSAARSASGGWLFAGFTPEERLVLRSFFLRLRTNLEQAAGLPTDGPKETAQ